MSESHYLVDWPKIRRAFPPGVEPPALLGRLAEWLDGRPWGSVGCFDLAGSFSDDAPIVDGSPLRREFGLFIHLPDGGKAGFWYRPGHPVEAAPIVGLGSEGEATVLATTLEGFLAKIALLHFDDGRNWSDFAPSEFVEDATEEFAAWLRQLCGCDDLRALVDEDEGDALDFAARMDKWMYEREAHWAEHPSMVAIARLLEAHRPAEEDRWGRTHFEVAMAGSQFEMRVLRGGPQPVPEADRIEPILRELRTDQARTDPGLGLWFGADLTLSAKGQMLPRFEYQSRPTIAGVPASLDEARANLARAPRPERWVPDWLRLDAGT